MPRPRRIEYPNAIHHVTMRGNRRLPVFERRNDYEVYLSLLAGVAGSHGWLVLSYCLMPNHLHLLLQTPQPNLSDGMRRLNGVYTRTYNDSRGIPGHVFQGRFKNQLVESNEHLITAFAYIALNPVKPRLCSRPEDWEWSAHTALAGHAKPAARRIVSADALACFDQRKGVAREKYRRYVASFADMLAAADSVEISPSEPRWAGPKTQAEPGFGFA